MSITNVQVSGSLDHPVNLHKLCYKLNNVVFNPKKIRCLIVEHKKISNKLLLFSSGHMCTHGKNYHESKSNLRKYARLISKHCNKKITKISNFKIVNISLTYNLRVPVNLLNLFKNLLLYEHTTAVSLEYEIFPGLIIKFKNDDCSFSCTIFTTGKMIFTGIRKLQHISQFVDPFVLDIILML